MPRPITDHDRAEVRRLHAAGQTRNAIARTIGRSGQTVSKLAAELGRSFDRGDQVRVATEARSRQAGGGGAMMDSRSISLC